MSDNSNPSGAGSEKSGTPPEEQKPKHKIPPEELEADFFKQKDKLKAAEKRAQELEDQLKQKELSEKEKSGNIVAALEQTKKEKAESDKKLKLNEYKFSKTSIESDLKQKAIENGCKNFNALMKLISEKTEAISVDENFIPDSKEVEKTISDAMKEYDGLGLFGKDVKVVDIVPKGGNNIPKEKTKPKTEEQIISDYAKKFV